MLQKLAAMRSYMRDVTLDRPRNESVATAVGMTGGEIVEMYRLLAIAKYEERYVIPTAYEGEAHQLEELACSLDVDGGPGMVGSGPFGEGPVTDAVSVETFHALRDRQTSDDSPTPANGCPDQPAQLGRQGSPARIVPAPTRRRRAGRHTGSAATPSDPGRRAQRRDAPTAVLQAASVACNTPTTRAGEAARSPRGRRAAAEPRANG